MKEKLRKIVGIGLAVCLGLTNFSFAALADTATTKENFEDSTEWMDQEEEALKALDPAERLKQIDWKKAQSYNEYDLLQSLAQEPVALLEEEGYSDAEIADIQNYQTVLTEHITELAQIDEAQLRNLKYRDDQIYAIKNFDGSEEMLRTASADLYIDLSIDWCTYRASTGITSARPYFAFTWEGAPAIKMMDMMTVGWNDWVMASQEGFVQYAYIYDGPDYIDVTPEFVEPVAGKGYGGGYRFNAAIENNYFYAQTGYCVFDLENTGAKDIHTIAAYAHQTFGIKPSFGITVGTGGISSAFSFNFINTTETQRTSASKLVKIR